MESVEYTPKSRPPLLPAPLSVPPPSVAPLRPLCLCCSQRFSQFNFHQHLAQDARENCAISCNECFTFIEAKDIGKHAECFVRESIRYRYQSDCQSKGIVPQMVAWCIFCSFCAHNEAQLIRHNEWCHKKSQCQLCWELVAGTVGIKQHVCKNGAQSATDSTLPTTPANPDGFFKSILEFDEPVELPRFKTSPQSINPEPQSINPNQQHISPNQKSISTNQMPILTPSIPDPTPTFKDAQTETMDCAIQDTKSTTDCAIPSIQAPKSVHVPKPSIKRSISQETKPKRDQPIPGMKIRSPSPSSIESAPIEEINKEKRKIKLIRAKPITVKRGSADTECKWASSINGKSRNQTNPALARVKLQRSHSKPDEKSDDPSMIEYACTLCDFHTIWIQNIRRHANILHRVEFEKCEKTYKTRKRSSSHSVDEVEETIIQKRNAATSVDFRCAECANLKKRVKLLENYMDTIEKNTNDIKNALNKK